MPFFLKGIAAQLKGINYNRHYPHYLKKTASLGPPCG